MIQISQNSKFYEPISNKTLSISFGVLIAKGIIRKENAREILIELGIFQYIEPPNQKLNIFLAEEVVSLARKWKSPNDSLYKMFGNWWMEESTARCTMLCAFFTELEQIEITNILQKSPRSPPLDRS